MQSSRAASEAKGHMRRLPAKVRVGSGRGSPPRRCASTALSQLSPGVGKKGWFMPAKSCVGSRQPLFDSATHLLLLNDFQ